MTERDLHDLAMVGLILDMKNTKRCHVDILGVSPVGQSSF
jgi:hypothetical protein